MKSTEKILTALVTVHKKISAGESLSLDRVTRSLHLSGSVGTAMVDARIVERYGSTRDVSYKWITGPPNRAMAREVIMQMRTRSESHAKRPHPAPREPITGPAVPLGQAVKIDPHIGLNQPGFITAEQKSMLHRALGTGQAPENIFTSGRISDEKLYLIGQIAGAVYQGGTHGDPIPSLTALILEAADDLYNKIYSPSTSQKNEQTNHQGDR